MRTVNGETSKGKEMGQIYFSESGPVANVRWCIIKYGVPRFFGIDLISNEE
jgi:hypothetical protein